MPRIPRFEVFHENTGRDQWYWRLRGANGEIIAHSEGYASKYNALRGAKRARALARFALVRVRKDEQ